MRAYSIVSFIAVFTVSVCAWAQSPAQNLEALHADTEKAYLARDLVRAGELSKSLLAAASKVNDPKEMGFAELMAGRIFNASGDYDRALNSLERALQIYRDSNQTSGIATVFNEQATAYRFTGGLSEAFNLHEQARSIFEKANDKEGLANTYFELGNAYVEANNYRNALDAFQHSLQLAEEADLPRIIAKVTHGIGNVYSGQGNRELALEFYQRSLQIKERISNYYEIIGTLVNMATVYVSLGQLNDAHKQLDRALELAKPEDPRSRAQVMNRYGRLLSVEKKYDEALARLRETVELLSGGKDELLTGDTLVRIARIQAETNHFEDALKTAVDAEDLAFRVQSPILETIALEVHGVVARELDRNDEALASFMKMINVDEERRANVAGDAAQVQAYLRGEGDGMHEVVGLLIRLQRNEEAFRMAERNKGRALLTVLGADDERLAKHLTAGERNRETTLKQILVDTSLQLERAQRSPVPALRLKELETFVARSRLELAAFETTLYAAHPELQIHRNDSSPVSVEQAAQIIPDSRTLLLEYDLGPDHSYVFTVARNPAGKAVFNVHELKARPKDLIARVNAFRTSIAQRDLGYRDEARKLYDLLLAPAAAELAGKDTLVIVPDGALWQLPFQALETPSADAVIEKHAVFFAPSMTVLTRMRVLPPAAAKRMTLLAVGDAAVGLELPGLKDVYPSGESRIITGAQATENVVKAAASQYRIVHLAAHGFYDDQHPMNSYLQLARASDNDTEDGKLEAREMMTLDLNADMVILSACETARGDATGGEGLVGMTWALLVAGVPTAVASQWKVDSASTADLMVRFHRALSSQLSKSPDLSSKAKTLQQAVLGLMKNPQYRHPFYWAGFVMVGQGF